MIVNGVHTCNAVIRPNSPIYHEDQFHDSFFIYTNHHCVGEQYVHNIYFIPYSSWKLNHDNSDIDLEKYKADQIELFKVNGILNKSCYLQVTPFDFAKCYPYNDNWNKNEGLSDHIRIRIKLRNDAPLIQRMIEKSLLVMDNNVKSLLRTVKLGPLPKNSQANQDNNLFMFGYHERFDFVLNMHIPREGEPSLNINQGSQLEYNIPCRDGLSGSPTVLCQIVTINNVSFNF